jgi:2-polyprenyl-6-methoxyphenol hydroxylase-like FAD-dependent oxidoreductase
MPTAWAMLPMPRPFDAIQRAFASSSMSLAALRGAGLAVVDRIAPLKNFFAARAAGR